MPGTFQHCSTWPTRAFMNASLPLLSKVVESTPFKYRISRTTYATSATRSHSAPLCPFVYISFLTSCVSMTISLSLFLFIVVSLQNVKPLYKKHLCSSLNDYPVLFLPLLHALKIDSHKAFWLLPYSPLLFCCCPALGSLKSSHLSQTKAHSDSSHLTGH